MEKVDLRKLKIEYAKALATGDKIKADKLKEQIEDVTKVWVQPTKEGAQLSTPHNGIGLSGRFLKMVQLFLPKLINSV